MLVFSGGYILGKIYGADDKACASDASVVERKGQPGSLENLIFLEVFDSEDARVGVDHSSRCGDIYGHFLGADAGSGLSFTRAQLKRYCDLGLSKDEVMNFSDTSKPDAIVVLPSADDVDAFYNDPALVLYRFLGDVYDVFFRIASTENDVYFALDSVPEASLFILGGHGTVDDIALGKFSLKNWKDSRTSMELYKIDTSDYELGEHLQLLAADARIFLYSCENAKGGEGADNIANFIASLAQGRKVFSAAESFNSTDIRVGSLSPFDVRIMRDGKDVTYVGQSFFPSSFVTANMSSIAYFRGH
jgi:hypothetical protein